MIQCNDCSKQCRGDETKRRLKDRFNEHRRSVDNPSAISKATTVWEHFLTNNHSANDITLIAKSSRDSVGKAREAYLIERGKTLEPLGMNTVFISSICYHLFILFLHLKFLSNHYINGFCFQRSLFSHFTFTCYYSIKLHAILYFKLKRPSLTSSLCERPLKKESLAFRNIGKNIYIFPTIKSALFLLFYTVLLLENLAFLLSYPCILNFPSSN